MAHPGLSAIKAPVGRRVISSPPGDACPGRESSRWHRDYALASPTVRPIASPAFCGLHRLEIIGGRRIEPASRTARQRGNAATCGRRGVQPGWWGQGCCHWLTVTPREPSGRRALTPAVSCPHGRAGAGPQRGQARLRHPALPTARLALAPTRGAVLRGHDRLGRRTGELASTSNTYLRAASDTQGQIPAAGRASVMHLHVRGRHRCGRGSWTGAVDGRRACRATLVGRCRTAALRREPRARAGYILPVADTEQNRGQEEDDDEPGGRAPVDRDGGGTWPRPADPTVLAPTQMMSGFSGGMGPSAAPSARLALLGDLASRHNPPAHVELRRDVELGPSSRLLRRSRTCMLRQGSAPGGSIREAWRHDALAHVTHPAGRRAW